MNILKKLVLKDLKLNKKRTIGTIVGIVLSCALIMVVGGMFYTLRNSLLQNAVEEYGYYHLKINNLSKDEVQEFKNNRRISNVVTVYNIGDTYYNKDKSYTGDIYSMDKNTFDNLNYKIIEGHFPENSNEILINRQYQYNNDLKVGDTIKIEIGENPSSHKFDINELINSQIKNVKVAGIVNRYGDLITTNEKSEKYVTYLTFKNPKEYKENLMSILKIDDFKNINISKVYDNYYINLNVIMWEVFDLSDEFVSLLYKVLAVVIFIIMVTSVFSIRNSFAISTTEKLKTYGMLSSVGATKKQILKMVLFEGFVVGLIGITLGIILGLFVTIGLSALINFIAINANLFGENFRLYYEFSFLPIVISIVTSVVVIFLSVIMSAIKASHTSPIKNIRNADDIKGKKLKVPKFISKIFGIGGTLSYKNLKRSKKKYRVTIISLTVSILVFITTSSLVGYGIRSVKEEYSDLGYNIHVYGLGGMDNSRFKDDIEKVEQIKGAISRYDTYNKRMFILNDKSHINKDLHTFEWNEVTINISLYNDEYFKEFVKEINGNYEELKDKVILLNRGKYNIEGTNKYVNITDYKKGDKLELVEYNDQNTKMYYELGAVSDIRPIGLSDSSYNSLYLVGDYEYFKNKEDYDIAHEGIYFQSDNPYELEKDIKNINEDFYVENLDEQYKQGNTVILIISIIVYGFIIVVTLIGVTSVFNTINSNMELRSKDFATLKSIGMTKKEFNNMINLEAIFYSFKSLIYGVILGILGSIISHKAFLDRFEFEYVLPIKPILISIVFIVLLVLILMRYSIKKINKQNIIETIRNNNI